jgi:hypothetical protein
MATKSLTITGNRPAVAPFAIAVLFCNPQVRVPFQNQLWLSRILLLNIPYHGEEAISQLWGPCPGQASAKALNSNL